MTKPSSLNIKLSDTNWPKANKLSLLRKQVDLKDISNAESALDFELESKDFLTNRNFTLFSAKAEKEKNSQKEKKKASKTGVQK